MAPRSALGCSLWLVLLCAGCARSEARAPGRPVIAEPDAPEQAAPEPPPQPVAAGPSTSEPSVARLTGGVGNKVVGDFDQLRAAVSRIGPAIDDCYRSTAGEGGWRENLMWNLDVSSQGTVTRVSPHYAEYWRGQAIVPGTPAPALDACMRRALGQLVIAPPVRAGWVRLRFEQ